jgi:hypothetical protein
MVIIIFSFDLRLCLQVLQYVKLAAVLQLRPVFGDLYGRVQRFNFNDRHPEHLVCSIINLSCLVRPFQIFDDDLLHFEHGFHDSFRFLRVGVG